MKRDLIFGSQRFHQWQRVAPATDAYDLPSKIQAKDTSWYAGVKGNTVIEKLADLMVPCSLQCAMGSRHTCIDRTPEKPART